MRPAHTGTGIYWRLQIERKKRRKQRSNHRYRRKHPSHKMKYGHRFVRNEAYAKKHKVCAYCGRDLNEK